MKKLKLYLETSVWNFLFAEDAPDKKAATESFFNEVGKNVYEIFVSKVVEEEISMAPYDARSRLYRLIEQYDPVLLEDDDEAQNLAEMYVKNGVLARKHFNDLLHLAYASAGGMNALVSWNQSHLVKMKTHDLGNATNRMLGYHDIHIVTPQEVIEDEED